MKRVLAIVGAVGLVAVALVARGLLAGDDDDPGATSGARPVVACSPGLEDVCRALAEEGSVDGDTEAFDLGSTASTTGLVDDRRIDAWITWDPAGAIANFDVAAGDPVWAAGEVVGSSPVALGTKRSLDDDGCATPAAWSCVVRSVDAGASVAVGRADTIDGLVRLLPVASSTLADDESIQDLDVARVRSVVESSNERRDDFAAELRTYEVKRGAYDMIVGPAAGLDGVADSTTVTPAGDFAMTLVVTPHVDAATGWIDAAFGDDAVRAAVRAAGVEPGTGTLADQGRAGELYALRQEIAP